MPGYGAEERALFEDDATKLYEEVCQKGRIAASDYRIAEDGELRAAFDLLVEMGLLIFDSEQDGWAPEDPTSVQSRVVSPLSQEAAKLLSESSQWSSAFSNLSQSWRRAPQSSARGPFTYLRSVELINSVLDQLLAECEEELLTAQPRGRPRPAAPREGGAARHRAARARRHDAHALPAQRPAQLGHPQVRRRRHRARGRGPHPRRVLQPDDRGRPPGRGDPQPRRPRRRRGRSASRPWWPTSSTSSSAPGSAAAPFTNRETSLLKDIAAEQRAMTMRMLIEGHSDPVERQAARASARAPTPATSPTSRTSTTPRPASSSATRWAGWASPATRRSRTNRRSELARGPLTPPAALLGRSVCAREMSRGQRPGGHCPRAVETGLGGRR